MSDYGADENADLNIAREITKEKALLPFDNANVMQWTYSGGKYVQKYASKTGKSNLLVKYQE